MQITSHSIALAATAPASRRQDIPAPFGWQNPSPDDSPAVYDRLTLSPEGLKANRESKPGQGDDTSSVRTVEDQKAALTEEELKQLSQLKSRDREVRTHEQAHLAVAGQYAGGGASYTYKRGPDGNSYAVGGEVPIDIGSESTPEATIQKMRTIRRAALAPADPSAADRQIAANASAKELQARQEIAAALQEDLNGIVSLDAEGGNSGAAPSSPDSGNTQSEPATQNSTRKMMIAAYRRFIPRG